MRLKIFLHLFYLLYVNDDVSALKRISIDIKNNQTTEITLPNKIKGGVVLYYFLRSCDVKGDAVDFEPGPNKALG